MLLSLILFSSCKKDGSSPTDSNTNITPPPNPPSVPVPVAPANHSSNISIEGVFSWYAMQGADSYTVQVASDSQFTIKIVEQSGIKSSTLRMKGLIILTKYYWRVKAVNKGGASEFSSTWNFTTADSASSYSAITGIVLNNLTPQLAGVKVYTVPATATIYTDSTGGYLIKNIIPGSYTLYAEKDGFIKYSTSIYLEQGQVYEQNITLDFIGSVSSCNGVPTVTFGGKTYTTVQIGNECWLKENIDFGTMIDGTGNQTDNGSVEKYCYENKSENCATYGGLYQWGEAMGYAQTSGAQGVCPPGWHIPTKSEFQALVIAADNSRNLRAVGEGAGTDSSGFSALLGGYRYNSGVFYYLREHSTFWSSTIYSAGNANYMGLRIGDNTVNLGAGEVTQGFSVRCVKNE